ncbi:MAG: hypothetical protein V9G21_03180 [Methylotenera sp.]|jgi:hypothetical protein|nr:hypothetical protein [Methylotenera sp.]
MNRRIVYINDIGVIINDVDWNDYHEDIKGNPDPFSITFDVLVNDKNYTITFSNPSLDSQNQRSAGPFKGSGASYIQLLREVETRSELRDKNQYSEDTENEANNAFGTIAQSIYNDVQSHSPDQDED